MRALWSALLVAFLKPGCAAQLHLAGSISSNDDGVVEIEEFWVNPNSGTSPAAHIDIKIDPDDSLSNDTKLVYYFRSQGIDPGVRCEQLRDEATILANLTIDSNVTNSTLFVFESLEIYLPRASIDSELDEAEPQECTLVLINCDFIRRFDYELVVDPRVDPPVTEAPQIILGVPNRVTIIVGSILLGLFICLATYCCVRYQNRRTARKRRERLSGRRSSDTSNGVGHPQDRRESPSADTLMMENASSGGSFSARLRLIRSALNRSEKTHAHVHRGSTTSSLESGSQMEDIDMSRNMPPGGVLRDSDDETGSPRRDNALEDGTYDMTSVQPLPGGKVAKPDKDSQLADVSIVRRDSAREFIPPRPPHVQRSQSDSRHSISRRSAAAAAELPSHDDMSPEWAKQRRADSFDDAQFDSLTTVRKDSLDSSRAASKKKRAPRRVSFDQYPSVREISPIAESPEISMSLSQQQRHYDTDERHSRDFRNPFDERHFDDERRTERNPFDERDLADHDRYADRRNSERNSRNGRYAERYDRYDDTHAGGNPFDDRQFDHNDGVNDGGRRSSSRRNEHQASQRWESSQNNGRHRRSSSHHSDGGGGGGGRGGGNMSGRGGRFDDDDDDFRSQAADFFESRRGYGYER